MRNSKYGLEQIVHIGLKDALWGGRGEGGEGGRERGGRERGGRMRGKFPSSIYASNDARRYTVCTILFNAALEHG